MASIKDKANKHEDKVSTQLLEPSFADFKKRELALFHKVTVDLSSYSNSSFLLSLNYGWIPLHENKGNLESKRPYISEI